jgi:hypothetical protein
MFELNGLYDEVLQRGLVAKYCRLGEHVNSN